MPMRRRPAPTATERPPRAPEFDATWLATPVGRIAAEAINTDSKRSIPA